MQRLVRFFSYTDKLLDQLSSGWSRQYLFTFDFKLVLKASFKQVKYQSDVFITLKSLAPTKRAKNATLFCYVLFTGPAKRFKTDRNGRKC